MLSLAFCIDMSSSGTTGSSFGCIYPVPSPMTLAFDQRGLWSRHFQIPHPPIPVGGSFFEASLRFTFAATCRFARPPVGADRVFTQPTWTFTSGLPTDWSPAPPPDITTVATGQVPPAGLSPARMPTSIAAPPTRVPQLVTTVHKAPVNTYSRSHNSIHRPDDRGLWQSPRHLQGAETVLQTPSVGKWLVRPHVRPYDLRCTGIIHEEPCSAR